LQQQRAHALVLCGFSVANYALLYVTSILLARTLSVPDFDDYNVAVSSVLVLTSLATLGLEKYALRCLPAWQNHQDWARSKGFVLFARKLILFTSVVLVILFCLTLELTLSLRGKPYHLAIVIVALFLPATAMFQFILEVAAAYGGQVKGVATYRLLFPALLFALNAAVWILLAASGVSAAFCYGAAWILAIAVLYVTTQSYVPAPVHQAEPISEPGLWMRGALPMAAGSLVLTMLAQTGVIILELNHPDEAVVSAYAVAFQTGTFVVILATATNRLYAPRISALLDRGDLQALRSMARYRLLVIGPLTLFYLFVILAFGPSILSLFGPQYATEYPALCLIALGASISTIFSLAPTYMHFTNRDRIVLAALVAAAVLNLALCIPLSDRYGALGAAIAYAVPIALLHVGLWFFELYDLVRYKLAPWHA
jgi:O-antigen/teichoic acid export membrane protein